jgi:hypothetical protein
VAVLFLDYWSNYLRLDDSSWLFLPDNPVQAKFITERQKAISIDRVRSDQTGIQTKAFKKEQMIETFLDPKTWLMFLFNIVISIPNGGLTNVKTSSTALVYSTDMT